MTIIVILYLGLMLGIGWWASKTRISGMTDFLLAGRKLGLFLCAAAMAATHFGGGALMGGAEYGYKYGLSGAWYGIATGIGLIFLGLLTASKFRDLALYTVPDYLEERYDSKTTRVLGALLSLVALIGILAAQVQAAQGAFSIIGLDSRVAAVFAVVVFIAYTAMGGLWAAAITDSFQIAIAGIGVIIAGAIVLINSSAQGGLTNLLADKEVSESYLSLVGEGPSFIMWLLLPTVMYTLIGQDFYQRLFAAKSSKVAKNAALLGGVFLITISFFPALIGAGARAFSANIAEGEEAFPWVLQNLMNPLLGGVILAATLAAVMSTADSLLTAATSHVIKDIWIETLRPGKEHDEQKLLKNSRLVTVLVGLCALLIGMSLPTIVGTLIYSYTLYTAGVLVPVIGGLLWRGATANGAIGAIIIGSVIALFGIITGLNIWGAPTEIYAALGSGISFVFISLGDKTKNKL